MNSKTDVTEHSAATDCSTACELTMTLAAMRTAEAALREEPYERLPALAGTLAMAAHRVELMRERGERLESALKRIERWFGEFPDTGKFWDDDKTRPVTYGACYGSNGERDFMRQIAREALQ